MAKAATKAAASKPAPTAAGKGLAALAKKASAKAHEDHAHETHDEDKVAHERPDFAEMSGKAIANYIAAVGIDTPEDWAKLSLADKKDWLEEHAPGKKKRKPKAAAEPEATKKELVKIPLSKAVKVLTGEIVEGTDLFLDTINAVENLPEDKCKELASQLAESAGYDEFKLGGLLSRIQENGWYAPHESFKSYVEAEHNMKYRSAAYAVQIYNDIARIGVPYAELQEVPWTKLRTISPVLTPQNVEKWKKLALKQTVVQLVETVKVAKNKTKKLSGDTEPKTVRTITFKVHGDQDETVKAAIQKAKEDANTEHASVALEYICLDFMGSSKATLVQQLKAVGLDKALEFFNAAFPDTPLSIQMPDEEAEETAEAA